MRWKSPSTILQSKHWKPNLTPLPVPLSSWSVLCRLSLHLHQCWLWSALVSCRHKLTSLSVPQPHLVLQLHLIPQLCSILQGFRYQRTYQWLLNQSLIPCKYRADLGTENHSVSGSLYIPVLSNSLLLSVRVPPLEEEKDDNGGLPSVSSNTVQGSLTYS